LVVRRCGGVATCASHSEALQISRNEGKDVGATNSGAGTSYLDDSAQSGTIRQESAQSIKWPVKHLMKKQAKARKTDQRTWSCVG
jgi:hypothetical protein